MTVANASGTGLADDEAVYADVHKMIGYYLNEDLQRRSPNHISDETGLRAGHMFTI